MVRITEDIKSKMIEMRKSGSTYSEIITALGVTKERCTAYLRDIPMDPASQSAIEREWQRAEDEAKEKVLPAMGYEDIHDLNSVCSFSPSWDILAREKETKKWWLIDVTINGQKGITAKRDVIVDGYEHAILLKTLHEWKLIRIAMDIKNAISIKI